MNGQYSKAAVGAFVVLVVVYLVMALGLWAMQSYTVIKFTNDIKDILHLMTSLPFVALYLVVLLAATAGYARGAIMAKVLPFNKILDTELQKKTLESATIKTSIRGAATVTGDMPLLRALNYILTSRLPILAVVDEKTKVTGVITSHDFLSKLSKDFEQKVDKKLHEWLGELKVNDLNPPKPVVATANENLSEVIKTMIKERLTKLVVVNEEKEMKFEGTIDMLDLVSEFYQIEGQE